MKLLKKLFHKVHIHFLTFVYLFFSLITGQGIYFVAALVIVCVHELCHLLMAYCFHFQISEIKILPFGAYLSLKDFYFHAIDEELCVVLAGPCSHLFIYMLLSYFPHNEFYNYLNAINTFVFMFNLVPIYPMDGHRIVCLILQSFLDLKKAFDMSLKISVFSFVLLSVFYLQTNTIVMIIFLFFQQLSFYQFIPVYLREYLSQIPTLKHVNKKIIHTHFHFIRGKENYYLIHQKLYHQSQVYYELLKRIKL